MATSTLQLVVETRTRKLDQLQGKFKKTQAQLKKLQGNLKSGLTSAFRTVGNAGQIAARKIGTAFAKAGKKIGGFQKRLGGLRTALLGVGVGVGVRKAFGDASALESAETRINSLTKSYSKFEGVQEIAARSAEKFRLTQTEALQTYADLGSRLGGTAVDLKDLENIYEGFNTLLINNKVEAQQAAAAQLQLGQALGEGVLRAEEYNSLISATPQLLDEVARVLEVPRAGLKKLAGEGKISSEALIQALANIKTKGADQLEESLNGAFGASKDFNKALNELSTTIGTDLLPAIVPLLKGLTELLKLLGNIPKPARSVALAITAVGTAALFAAPGLKALFGILSGITASGVLAAGPWFALAAGISAAAFALNNYQLTPKGAPTADNLKRRGAELLDINNKLAAAEARRDKQTDERARKSAQATVDNFQDIRQRKLEEIRKIREGIPFRETPTAPKAITQGSPFKIGDVVGGGSSGGGAVAAGVSETNRLLEQQNDAYNNIRQSQLRLITLNGNITDLDKELLQNKFDYQDAIDRINETVAAGQRAELIGYEKLIQADKDRLATKDALAEDLANADAFGKIVQGIKPVNEELTRAQELLKGSFEIVSSSLTNGIKGLIDGTKEWKDILSDVASQLGSMFLNAAFSSLGAGLNIPGFADGGRPDPGKVSVVGERGPELFVPDTPGTVIPNEAFDAARGAMGGAATPSEAFADNTSSISTTNSYIRERAFESNNQTTVGSGGSMVIETQVINNVEYASVEQVRVASAAAAKQARAQVFSDMKNKPSRRALVGMK